MAVQTPASVDGAQGIIKIFNFTSVANGDTFAGPTGISGYWVNSATTTVGGNVTYSAGTYTFYVGATGALTLFVAP
jgi:hypothetical protein